MESNTSNFQGTSRKLSSFEDLFFKISSINSIKIMKLKLNLKYFIYSIIQSFKLHFLTDQMELLV